MLKFTKVPNLLNLLELICKYLHVVSLDEMLQFKSILHNFLFHNKIMLIRVQHILARVGKSRHHENKIGNECVFTLPIPPLFNDLNLHEPHCIVAQSSHRIQVIVDKL